MPAITNCLSGTSAKLLDNTNVTLRFDSSSFTNQVVTLADKTYTNKITITRPFELIASNIKKGVAIAGITGTYEVVLNTETAETPLSMKDGNQVILPSQPNYTLSKVTVVKPDTFTPENIKNNVEIGGVVGNCTSLKELLETGKSHSAAYLFYGSGASSVDNIINYSDTEHVYNFSYMFAKCTELTSVPLLAMSGSNQISLDHMFDGCKSLSTIPLFNTEYATIMDNMFAGCTNLTTIPQLNTSKATTMTAMLQSCSSLTTVPLLDTSNVIYMTAMFQLCSSLTSVPLLNTSKVQQMRNTFYGCSSLTTIPQFNTSNVTTMDGMLTGCTELISVPLLDTSNVTNMSSMFWQDSKLTTVQFTDVSKVTDCSSMFQGCTSLKTVIMPGLSTYLDISYSTQFETDDLVTILNNLATVTTSQTLRMGATNLAKLSDEQKKIATDKGWTLA